MSTGILAIRGRTGSRTHHLWNNNGTWWCHYTVHLPDFTKKRVRISLDTHNPNLAMRMRDSLLKRVSVCMEGGCV
jgi:hypothetical protein